ncbi:MAG TPA: tetratricopeptide repeat protein [Gemmatimonadetes bacterium]|nr:tetratricopeptide repeat protein [Gemmatimonadota bacterium]
MRSKRALPLLWLLWAAPVAGQTVAEGQAELRSGNYDDAQRTFRRVLRDDASSLGARRGLIEVLTTQGEYEEAEGLALAAPEPVGIANALGEVLLLSGKLDEADRAFRRAIDGGAPDALTAEANLAELLFDRGEIDEATRRFDRFIDIYNDADGRLRAADLVAVGRAVSFLGRTEPALFHDALRAFDEASAADPGWPEPLVRVGSLFLGKYDSPSAQTEFQKALAANPRHPGALFGLAAALEFDGSSQARNVLAQLLDLNPNHVEARAMRARQHLIREGYAEAREEAEKALLVNPNSLSALTALAGVHLAEGDLADFREVRSRALSINPHYAALDATLADLSVKTRRYVQAVARAEAAVQLDSASWEAWGLLGLNELRLGQIEKGRADLERAFAGDPYNPWFKNNLDLLDTFDRFETVRTEHFELFLHGTEADLLATYLVPIVEEAYDSLFRRYRVEPPLPVRVELFPSHADFSVRTLGEVGLGALGVSFGSVLIMDSPGAREVGDYNWASVFWHELAHTFHLGMTDNRVPRWFSEGLAVHEQRQGRAGWGHQPSLAFLRALRDGELKKVSELNDGFMRPAYPEQVIFSYYQASLVFQVIEDRHGFDAIRRMLDGYRRGETTVDLFESVLGESLDDFDDEFDDYLKDRFRSPLRGLAQLGEPLGPTASTSELEDFLRSNPGDLVARLRLGAMLVGEERFDEAESHLEEALRIFPEYGGGDSPHWYLAQIHRARGDLQQAVASLERLTQYSESAYDAFVMQADLLVELGRPEEAALALDKAVLVWPYDTALHLQLAELNSEVGFFDGAVRERAAVVALAPTDMAEAHYLLAVAYRDADDRVNARRSLLRALDLAPNYEEALELLLELRARAGN